MVPESQMKKMEEMLRSAREVREKLWQDPHRPQYHFMPPAGWMNDINGAVFWKGRYHIFFQHNPDGAYGKRLQWGHASSADLAHWVHHPIALTPTASGPDRDGCFSGGAVVKDGVPTLIYYGKPDGICIATSEDDDLVRWTKHPGNPVIRRPKPGEPEFGRYMVYDPCAWKRGNNWYAISGGWDPEGGDTAYLFKSRNLTDWQYVRPFYKSERRWTEAEDDCAVPDFFPLGGKHMLLFCSRMQGTQYYLGLYDGEQFHPEAHGLMSWPGGHLGGGITMLDGKGRRLYFDWVREARTDGAQRVSGWSGVMTVPRLLSLPEDGTLRIEPAPELTLLRRNPRRGEGLHLGADSTLPLKEVSGTCLELCLEVMPDDARQFGVKVRSSPDGSEQTVIVCDLEKNTLSVDVSKSTLDESIRYYRYRKREALERLPENERTVLAQTAPFQLQGEEPLDLHIFLDHSIVEVFANSRQCVTQRIYPTREDSVGVGLFCRGGSAKVNSFEAWDMARVF